LQSGFTRNLRTLKKRSVLGQFVVTLLSCELLFFASFISITLPIPTSRNLQQFAHNCEVDLVNQLPPLWQDRIHEKLPVLKEPTKNVRFSTYMPLIPLSVAMAYVLGLPLAVLVCGLHFLLGMTGPPQGVYLFCSGGGAGYWQEPGFGYLIGIIFGAWFAAWITAPEERKSWRQLLAAFGGISITHLIGLVYVFSTSIMVLLFEGEASYLHFQPWLTEQMRNLSWYTLPYDLAFATILVALSFPLRMLLFVLTSPDVSQRQRPNVETQLEVLQETTA